MAKQRVLEPWWLEVGTEICPVCHHLYLYETEHRCPGCDGAVCSSCVDNGDSGCRHCGQDDGDDENSIEIDIEV